jgi:hypothetical protein
MVSINMFNIYIQDIIVDYTTFLHKTFSVGLNKHYGRSVKGIISEPTRRFPHTRVTSNIHLAPATGGIKP